MLFASRAIRDRSAFVIVKMAAQVLRDGSQLVDKNALLELVNSLGITSARHLHKEQLARWPSQAWPRPAIDAWWREKFNPTGKTGPKGNALKRAAE